MSSLSPVLASLGAAAPALAQPCPSDNAYSKSFLSHPLSAQALDAAITALDSDLAAGQCALVKAMTTTREALAAANSDALPNEALRQIDATIDSKKAQAQQRQQFNIGFNDISDTINASVYGWYHFSPKIFVPGTEVGIGAQYTAQSRDTLGQGDDSINSIHSLGLRIAQYPFVFDTESGLRQYRNGMPQFISSF